MTPEQRRHLEQYLLICHSGRVANAIRAALAEIDRLNQAEAEITRLHGVIAGLQAELGEISTPLLCDVWRPNTNSGCTLPNGRPGEHRWERT